MQGDGLGGLAGARVRRSGGRVVAVAAAGHRAAGVLAAVSAAVWFDFFLTVPYERFTITGRRRTARRSPGRYAGSGWW